MKKIISALLILCLPVMIFSQDNKNLDNNSVIRNGTFLYHKADNKEFSSQYKEISTLNLTDGKVILVKKINLKDVRTNPDKTQFYKTTYGIIIDNGNNVKINEIETNLYTPKQYDQAMMPCMIFDAKKNVVTIFANGKDGISSYYGMEGNTYRIDLESKTWTKEILFEKANWGFFSFFGGSNNGNPELWHFSYAGYFALKSYRNANGTWTTDNKGSIRPEVAAKEYPYHNNILVTSATNVASMISNKPLANNSNSYSGINSNDIAIGSTIMLGALLWEGAKLLLGNNDSSTDINSSSNYSDNNNKPQINSENKCEKEAEYSKYKIKEHNWDETTFIGTKYRHIDFEGNTWSGDGTYSGRIFYSKDHKLYYLDVGGNHYYKNYEDVVYALFVYKKCKEITKIGLSN